MPTSSFVTQLRRRTAALPVLIILLIGALWLIQDYQNYLSEIARLKGQYIHFKKQAVTRQLDLALQAIQSHRTSAASTEDVKEKVKQELSSITFDNGRGYIFAFTYEGIGLVNNTRPNLIGTNILHLKDPNGKEIIKELRNAAKQPDGGVVQYLWENPTNGRLTEKMSYVRGIDDWQWVIGAGTYFDDVDTHLAAKKKDLIATIWRHCLFAGALIVLVLMLIQFFFRRFVEDASSEIQVFTDWFEQAAKEHVEIDVGSLRYQEFRDLAGIANKMLETRASAMQALQDSDLKLRTLMESLPTGMLLVDADTRQIVDVNQAAAELIGLSPFEICGTTCHKFVCPAEEGSCPVLDLGQKVECSERILLTSKKEPIPIHKTVAPVEIQGKRYLLESFIDISTQKEALSELHRAKNAAEDATESKSQFLANMSHEIRTPMNGILGMTELLLESGLSERQQDLAGSVSQSAESLLTIINDILDFSKIEAGKMVLNPTEFSLSKFADSLEKTLAVTANQKQITIVHEIAKNIPDRLIGDTDRLRQVLVNLIGNSVKFTPQGGGIVLQIAKDFEAGSRISLHFSVSDSGIGIAPEKQKEIFGAFTQADAGITRQFGGTGLGLSICKHLVNLMGGDISLLSEPGKGSVFHFTADFEICKSQEAEDQPLPPPSPTTHGVPQNLKILLAEDNAVNQKVAIRMLESAGCEVTLAQNGREAVELAEQRSFDVILMDIQMPIMGGEEAARLIREHEKQCGSTSLIPIVALTAHAMAGDREKYLQRGLTSYLAKPFSKKALIEVLVSVTQGSAV